MLWFSVKWFLTGIKYWLIIIKEFDTIIVSSLSIKKNVKKYSKITRFLVISKRKMWTQLLIMVFFNKKLEKGQKKYI